MKKAGLFAIVLSAVLLSGCGQDINEKMDEPVSTTTAAAASEIKYEGTASAAATETETESVTIAETVSEENVDTENTAKNENTEKTDDYSDIAGYWFVDGERSKSALLFTSDGKFTAYYPSGASFDGYIEKNFDQESNSYAYCLYQSTEKLYNTFPDNGEKEKTDIYMSTEDGTHYVKLYGEGGIAPDGKASAEDFLGTWDCGSAIIEISEKSEGEYSVGIIWRSDAASHMLWNYPVVLEDGKLICKGNGQKVWGEFKNEDPNDYTQTVKYTDGSAEFTLDGIELLWNDFQSHDADSLRFTQIRSVT